MAIQPNREYGSFKRRKEELETREKKRKEEAEKRSKEPKMSNVECQAFLAGVIGMASSFEEEQEEKYRLHRKKNNGW